MRGHFIALPSDLGILFRRQKDVERKHEIVIVVRPFVLSTPVESEALSHRVLDALEVDPKKADVRKDARDADEPRAPIGGPGARVRFEVMGLGGEEVPA